MNPAPNNRHASHLPVGIFTGKITINSQQAGNSSMEVFVTLQVIGETIYLPIITKRWY